MQHAHTNDELMATAALYALGALSQGEALSFAEHLESCRVCAEHARVYREAVEGLGEAAPVIEPPARLRARVLATVAAAAPDSPPSSVTVRGEDGGWREICEGVRERILFEDAATGRKTGLVRMEPGASVAPHRHVGVEEVYILEGDCHVAHGHVLRPGDYFRAEAGTSHPWTYSEQGTLFLSVFDNEFETDG